MSLDGGQRLSAQVLVLALGNAPPAPLASVEAVRKNDLIDLFWTPHAQSRVERAAANDEPVLIVGQV